MAAHERSLDVGVGVAFRVAIAGLAGDDAGQRVDEVSGDGRVGAFVDSDSGRGVRHEYVHHTCEVVTEAGQGGLDALGDIDERLARGRGYGELDQRSEVEVRGLEPLAFAMRTRRSPN